MSGIADLAARLQAHHWRASTWMWDIRDAIADLDISQVAMTGTHNTATYDIKWSSKFGRDGPDALRSNGALAGLVHVFGGPFLPAWAKCQRMTVAQQLQFGVRYLDLRIAPHSSPSTTLYTTHGLLSTPLDDVLAAVAAFVTAPATCGEFVLLDFQHVFLSPADPGYAALFQSIARIQEICVPRPRDGRSFPSLGELWQGRQRIFVFMGCDFDVEKLSCVCSRDTFLSSPWLNRHNKKDLMRALDVNATEANEDDANKVFLTQAIVTPNANTVLAGTFSLGVQPSSLKALAKDANVELIHWFWQRNITHAASRGKHKNILLLDYPELHTTEICWDGGSLKGTVVDVCVCINLLRGPRQSACAEFSPRHDEGASPGTVED